MEVLQAMETRRSIRSFTCEDVPLEDLKKIVNAGRLAPTGKNCQDWRFVIITDEDKRRAIAEGTVNGPYVRDGGAIVVILMGRGNATPLFDTGTAMENMMLMAHELGYGSVWVNSYRRDHSSMVHDIVHGPEDMEVMAMLEVGRVKDWPHAPEKKSLEDVVIYNQFA